MKRLLFLMTFLCACISLQAQYSVAPGYRQWFDDEHAYVMRQAVDCNEDGQDLWNGCYVRIQGDEVHVYGATRYGSIRGHKVWLFASGCWCVRRGGTEYLYSPEGEYTGIAGIDIVQYPWNYYGVQKGNGKWYIYNADGASLPFYSDDKPILYWNGCWGYTHNGRVFAADRSGDWLPNVYGDEVRLMNNGRWRCTRNGRVYFLDGE